MLRIGLVSDTHGYLDPQVPNIFRGVDLIFHAGDVGSFEIIRQLETIAPVTAVVGNTDAGLPLRETEVVRASGGRFLIHHILDPLNPSTRISDQIASEQPHVVIFGHTHKAFHARHGPIAYVNPGYAGKQRFKLIRSVALLHWDGEECQVTVRTL
jgi:uncharacterized protein